MRNRIEAHRLGQYVGTPSAEWLVEHRLVPRSRCNRLVVGSESCRAESRPDDMLGSAASTSSGAPPDVVDVAGVLATNRSTSKFVPASCRFLWSSILPRALSAVVLVSCPGFAGQPWERELAWAELIALPKAVLQPAPRSGRKHKRCQENHTRCLLQRWMDGENIQLFAVQW